MKTDIRYVTSDVFDTFARPIAPPAGLERLGERYFDSRKAVMNANGEGLTKTYNRFHDPDDRTADIQTLRNLHVEMD